MKLFPYKWYLSYWFIWILVSIIYIGIFFITGELFRSLGVIVPIGPFSWLYMLDAPVTGLVFILSIIFADKLAFSIIGIRRSVMKLIFNFYMLLFITFFIDSIIFGGWYSFIAIFDETGPIGDDGVPAAWTALVQSQPIVMISKLMWLSIILVLSISIIRNVFKYRSVIVRSN